MDLKMKARELRKHGTLGEIFLWLKIRNRQLGVQFHRQVPMLDFIVDFYCHEIMLAIEIDGSSHNDKEAVKYDLYRQGRLESEGVIFLRFSEGEARNKIKRVVNEIYDKVNELRNGK